MRFQWTGVLLACAVLAAFCFACAGGSDSGILNMGDDDAEGDGDADDEIANEDGDDLPDGDTDGDGEETEALPTETKCDVDRHNNDRIVTSKDGGTTQVCIPGDPLDGVKVKILPDALKDDINVTLSITDNFDVDDWVAVGPAIYFEATPLENDGEVLLEENAEFAIPFKVSQLPELAENFHINVAVVLDPKTGVENGDDNAPLFIPKSPSLIRIDRERELLIFPYWYFGTIQAMVPAEILPPTTRHFTYKAVSGVSMGGIGSSITGFRYPDRFDILGPLGGSMNMGYLLNMMHDLHLGGFCDYDTITGAADIDAFVTDTTQQCGWCGPQHDPEDWSNPGTYCYMVEPRSQYPDEHAQGYNHWYYDDDGGNFNRSSYMDIFRDLAYAFGNPTNYNPASPYLPVGLGGERVVDQDRLQTYLDTIYDKDQQAHGCAELATWMASDPLTELFDHEYNPEGLYPAIYYCDGTSQRNGHWDPDDSGARSRRMDIGIAIDFNENGVRDYGEPVIRQFWEPYEDCGLDGLCDENETGYNADSNPDPAGDNYHPFDNPTGTEENGFWDGPAGSDPGETYQDLGLDGVACPVVGESTPQAIKATCPYDYGEGNGQFDLNPNIETYFAHDPLLNAKGLTDEQVKRLNIWFDGGIRDIFNFLVMADGVAMQFNTQSEPLNLPVKKYQRYTSLMDPVQDNINSFNFLRVNYAGLGQNVLMRYGDYDATDAMIAGGDGRHVGYIPQLFFRIQTFFSFANHHFANGDFEPVESSSLTDLLFSSMYDSDVLGRKARYSVALPPGYYSNNQDGADGAPDTCVNRYPVIYLGHGYGMDPQGMAGALTLFMSYMSDGIFQKMITVFPDGECYDQGTCRGDCNSQCNNVSAADKPACLDACYTERGCDDVITECVRGNFYVNHVVSAANPVDGMSTGGLHEVQTEDSLLELMDYIDSHYCTKEPEDVQVDGATLDGLY